MNVWYNDNDHFTAQWLQNLIVAGLPAGIVDERSIVDVSPADLAGYSQCHFFAGIGGWPLALNLAGWHPDRPVWTGSCPCQPFSCAGKQGGSADERHLWHAWFRLIRECRPNTIFGEQVAGAIGFGWLDRVFADLETEGYACGAAVLGAHSVGAPHIRQRLFWVADAGHAIGWSLDEHRQDGCDGSDGGWTQAHGWLGDADSQRREGQSIQLRPGQPRQPVLETPWSGAACLPCLDGKARRVEPGVFPLAHGIPNRVGRLRAYGNAIVPQVAAEFVAAFLEIER